MAEKQTPEHPSLWDRNQIPLWYTYIVKPLFLLFSPVIVPLRLLAFLILVGLSSFVDYLLNLGTNPDEPLPVWRQKIYEVCKPILYKTALFFGGYLVITRGKARKDVRAICVNHQSMIDVCITAATGIHSAIAKANIANNPFFGPTLRVTRSYLARTKANLNVLEKRLTEQPQRYQALGVFPAGTTTNQRLLPRFRTGIFIHKPDVQIATIKYHTYENIFYINDTPFYHLKKVLLNPLAIVVMTYHPEVYKHTGNESPQDYADRVALAMAKKIGGVYTKYDFKDVLWFGGATELKEQLSQKYVDEQLWRGDWNEWAQRCYKCGLDPHLNFTQQEVEEAEKRSK